MWRGIAICLLLVPFARAQEDALAAKSRVAKQALQDGRYAESVRLYRELTAALPDNAGLRLNLGLALEKAGQAAEAIPELERVTRAQPGSAPAWFLLGLAYQQLGQPRNAIAPLRQAVTLDDHNAAALFELADAQLAAGDPAAAAGSFRALSVRQPGMAKAWQGLGLAYVSLGERAVALLARQAPRSGYRHALAARARAGEQRYSEALSLYAQALKELPELPGLHAARAAMYRATNHPDWAAVEDGREARVAKPDCHTRPAACAVLAGDWEKALREARQATTPENLYWSSLAYNKLAEQSFAKLAALPPSAELHELQAESFQRLGRRVEAVAEWRQALAMDPGNRRLRGRLAESLARNRSYEEAARLLEPLAAAQPENGEWQYLLGDALLEQRRQEAALPHLVAAARLRPEFLPAQAALGRAYLALGQAEKAVGCLEKARALQDAPVYFALGTAYRRLGRAAEARAAMAEYQRLTPASGAAPAAASIPPPE